MKTMGVGGVFDDLTCLAGTIALPDAKLAPQQRLFERPCVIAIPACNEADRIEGCLAALICQRDREGRPLSSTSYSIVVLANDCKDETAALARAFASFGPVVHVAERTLPPEQCNAGWARKHAMDAAATLLEQSADHHGAILTTDADSVVSSTWIDETRRCLDQGADAVAGYIDAMASEYVSLGQAFRRRGWCEDRYLAAVAEIAALCDPIAHDPWPNHRVSSGASLAVTLAAYRSIGGLPPRPLGEDAALTEVLEGAGFRVRHSMDVCATTSCRFDGRAKGGAADTMRDRHAQPDLPCDSDLEPATAVLRRASLRRRARRWFSGETPDSLPRLARRLSISPARLLELSSTHANFLAFWRAIEGESVRLERRDLLRPSMLNREIDIATTIIRRLRMPWSGRSVVDCSDAEDLRVSA